MIDIAGMIASSTIDYPGKHCSVIYLWGCDFRCPFCHNKDLVLNPEICKKAEIKDIVKKLNDNFLIDAVCITGGEPLMQEDVIKMIAGIRKNTPLAIKLDTNGSFPERLEKVIPGLNFVAIDIKAPFEKYSKLVGVDFDIEKVRRSLSLLRTAKIFKEARTTIVPGLNDSEEDILAMAKIAAENRFDLYTIQQFRPKNTLDPEYEKIAMPSADSIRNLGKIARGKYPTLRVRVATLEHGFEFV